MANSRIHPKHAPKPHNHKLTHYAKTNELAIAAKLKVFANVFVAYFPLLDNDLFN
jgi:hypothetical protein